MFDGSLIHDQAVRIRNDFGHVSVSRRLDVGVSRERLENFVVVTCGCSLVKLGVSNDQAVPHSYNGKEYRFCCQACIDVFQTDPQKYSKRRAV